MRNLHILIFIELALFCADAPGQWERVNPKPTNVPLNGIWLFDTLDIWAVGSHGTIVHTTDGGNTWSERLLSPKAELQKIYFTNPLHGVIVGGDISAQNGALFVTTDGGITWVDKHPNPTYRYAYFDVQFLSASRGCIAGFEGIFRTSDGGQSWLRSTSSGLGWNTSVFFIDSLHGWCTNPSGRIMKSSDGGETWQEQASLGWRWFERIRFATSQAGWAVGGLLYETKGMIARTTDGGTTWILQDSTEGIEYHDIHVIDSLHAWIVGDRGMVQYTTNGGDIWYAAPTNNTDTYQDIAFQGDQTWIVGGSYNYPVILTARQGGWPRVTNSSYFSLAGFSAIQFSSDTTGWLACDDGTLFKSTNGGISWQAYNLFAVPWHSMSAPDAATLFVGGDNGTFLRTTDAGRSWVLSSVSGVYSVAQMQFVNPQVGWIIGGDGFGGLLYKTTDGGITWMSLGVGGSKVEFQDEQSGWLIQPMITSKNSEDATVLRHTTNGGLTWSSQLFYFSIRDIAFLSPEKGWMIAGYDSVLQTTDGGSNWQLLTRLADFPYELRFVTDKEGWVRAGQSIFHTTDGGLTFTPEYGALTQTPQKMYFHSSKLGFVFGNYGGLLRYSKLITGIGESQALVSLPNRYTLYQNYPNPFNPITEIGFHIAEAGHVTLNVYDILGREVATLVNERKAPGTYEAKFDGSHLASGVYFYRLSTNNFVQTRKLVLLR